MRTALGVVCIVFGILGWGGQMLSALFYGLAQRLRFQEKSEGTDALFRGLEKNAARWDALVLWTMPLAGALMIMNNVLWPVMSILAGGIYIDTGGREAAKWLALRAEGVGVGTQKDRRIAAAAYAVLFALGAVLAAAGAAALIG